MNPFKFISFAEDAGGGTEDVKTEEVKTEESKVDPLTGHFSEGFSEETRNHPSLKKFTSTEELGKSYINLETKIGSKGVIIPKEGAGKEEIQAYHEALGNITDSAKVEIVEIPKDTDSRIIMTDTTKQGFKDIVSKLNLNPGQAKGLQEWWLDRQVNNLKTYDKETKTSSEVAQKELRSQWGEKYDENLAKAAQFVKVFGGDKALEWFDKGEGNNPIVLAMLANAAGKISEDILGDKGSGSLTKTPSEAKIEIQQIRDNKAHPFNDGNHRDHKEAVAYMSTLYAMANPEKKE